MAIGKVKKSAQRVPTDGAASAESGMTKAQAIAIFGKKSDLARALGVDRSLISQWPEALTQAQADWVMGAALRLSRPLPGKAFHPGQMLKLLRGLRGTLAELERKLVERDKTEKSRR